MGIDLNKQVICIKCKYFKVSLVFTMIKKIKAYHDVVKLTFTYQAFIWIFHYRSLTYLIKTHKSISFDQPGCSLKMSRGKLLVLANKWPKTSYTLLFVITLAIAEDGEECAKWSLRFHSTKMKYEIIKTKYS